MTTTALVRSGHDTVDSSTGEVLTPSIDMAAYLARLSGSEAITEQRQLAAAYDAACASLIGENDVQVEGKRTFKKKSAWRKLARHFGISTSVVNVQKEVMEGAVFMATVTVRASAPWGQYAEAVGACGTDEESGRRKITMADAVATAETRATNRAVSNLVAMGEVSAEEMTKGNTVAAPIDVTPITRESEITFGKMKGTKISDLQDSYLEWGLEEGRNLGPRTKEWQEAFRSELAHRDGATV